MTFILLGDEPLRWKLICGISYFHMRFRQSDRGKRVPRPKHSWHESVLNEGPPAGSSDRSFGLVFATIFGVLGVVGLWRERESALWLVLIAVVFLALAFLAPPLLGPLNRAWRWVSVQLSKVANPLIMAVIFFGAVTPIGLLARILGKDPLRLRFEGEGPTYWIDRRSERERPGSMTKQF